MIEPTAEEIARHADALYQIRESAENVRTSVELLQRAASDDYEAAWRLGRALFFLGQEARDAAEARTYHARGVEACARAVRLDPSRVGGRFWLGVNLALQAQKERLPRSLALALRALRELRRAARLDPAYHAAGPLRVLARLEHKLPRWLGGGATRARAHFEQAIRLAPSNTVTRLYFAELLQDSGDPAAARAQLEALLDAPADPAWEFETRRDRALAIEFINRMDRMKRTG